MKTWTTTRWQLEHRKVQGGIEPLRLKSHQALNFKMKLNLISCVLPDFGSLMIYFIRTLIDNSKIYFCNRMIGKYRKNLELDRKGEKKMIIHNYPCWLRNPRVVMPASLLCFGTVRLYPAKILFAYNNLTIDAHWKALNEGIIISRRPSPGKIRAQKREGGRYPCTKYKAILWPEKTKKGPSNDHLHGSCL